MERESQGVPWNNSFGKQLNENILVRISNIKLQVK
jgi:hypothetical protein